MRLVRAIDEVRLALAEPRSSGARIGLVPTMGALHDGHLELLRSARTACDVVVMSLFVNPAQFNEARDLDAYPRDEQRDIALAEAAGVDLVFAPPVTEMYPPGFATTVSVAGLSQVLEGVERGRRHFDAVATVVAKLLNIVAPEIAYFGQKDAQQALVLRRLVRDLAMPVQIEVCPTVRELDGLAMSSRNVRLSPEERARSLALHRSLELVRAAIATGERDATAIRAQALAELEAAGIEPEYLELVSPEDLAPVREIAGAVLAVVAARVGDTRLIDNELIPAPSAGGSGRVNGETSPTLSRLAENVA
jgi:pantoate--beta-alanine ligase